MITTPPGAPSSQDAWRQGDPGFQSRISLRSFFHTTTPDDALTAPGGVR